MTNGCIRCGAALDAELVCTNQACGAGYYPKDGTLKAMAEADGYDVKTSPEWRTAAALERRS